MSDKWEIVYKQAVGAQWTVRCCDDETLEQRIASITAEGFESMQIKHLECRHRWLPCDPRGQIPGDLVNYISFRCELCDQMLLNVLDYELSELLKDRQ